MPKFILYFSAVMSLLYVVAGVFIAFSNKGALLAAYPYHVFIGLLVMGYGIFRAFRFYKLLFGEKSE
jgi:hypothetical protein